MTLIALYNGLHSIVYNLLKKNSIKGHYRISNHMYPHIFNNLKTKARKLYAARPTGFAKN